MAWATLWAEFLKTSSPWLPDLVSNVSVIIVGRTNFTARSRAELILKEKTLQTFTLRNHGTQFDNEEWQYKPRIYRASVRKNNNCQGTEVINSLFF
jgi:hypothetical protein